MNKFLVKSNFAALALMAIACSDSKVVVEEAKSQLDPQLSAQLKQETAVDPLLANQWSLNKISATSEMSAEGGKKVVIAVVGSGVDYTHEDLRNNILVNTSESQVKAPGQKYLADGIDDDNNGYKDDIVGYDFVDGDGYAFDQIGSGTAVAGVIAAVGNNGVGVRGVAPKAKLIPIRYIDTNGRGHVLNLSQSLEYAHARRVDLVSVHLSNMKFGQFARGDEKAEAIKLEQASLKSALDKLRTLKIPVVVSAGNTGADLSGAKGVLSFIASYPNVLVVTSVDSTDKRPFVANFGMQSVHLAAPGVDVLTTVPGNKYEKRSGSSLAAAHVAGALSVAIVKYFGRYESSQYFGALLSSYGGDPIESLKFETVSGNRLNLAKFLKSLE